MSLVCLRYTARTFSFSVCALFSCPLSLLLLPRLARASSLSSPTAVCTLIIPSLYFAANLGFFFFPSIPGTLAVAGYYDFVYVIGKIRCLSFHKVIYSYAESNGKSI